MSEDLYEQAARAQRLPELQNMIDAFAEAVGIEQDFVDSCEHPYNCTCHKCLKWWATIGPEDEEDMTFGPFTQEQVEAYCESEGLPIWWNQSATSADSTS